MKQISILLLLSLAFSCSKKYPVAKFETEIGEFMVELYPEKAPVTVANFIKHCNMGTFESATFYRLVNMQNQPMNDVKIEVIQGGLLHDSLIREHPSIRHETTRETGILHLDGTLSMARLEPGTASTEFFICVGDQPSLDFGGDRNPDGQGFAAFGRVITGMEVVHAIHDLPAPQQMLTDPVRISNISVIQH